MKSGLIKEHNFLKDSSNILIFFREGLNKSRLSRDIDMTYSHVNKTINFKLKPLIKFKREGRTDHLYLTKLGEEVKYHLIQIYKIIKGVKE